MNWLSYQNDIDVCFDVTPPINNHLTNYMYQAVGHVYILRGLLLGKI